MNASGDSSTWTSCEWLSFCGQNKRCPAAPAFPFSRELSLAFLNVSATGGLDRWRKELFDGSGPVPRTMRRPKEEPHTDALMLRQPENASHDGSDGAASRKTGDRSARKTISDALHQAGESLGMSDHEDPGSESPEIELGLLGRLVYHFLLHPLLRRDLSLRASWPALSPARTPWFTACSMELPMRRMRREDGRHHGEP